MRSAEDELIGIFRKAGVNIISSLPCERVKNLLLKIPGKFEHISITREEAGVGISAGSVLAGRKPAMVIQNSGIGNMINALLSLTSFYNLPLALFLSHRGVYKEKIAAQIPMGKHVAGILKAACIGYTNVKDREELYKVTKPLERVYRENRIHAFLLSPKVWEGSRYRRQEPGLRDRGSGISFKNVSDYRFRVSSPKYTRYEILKIIAPYLDGKAVVCNLGFPSKELYHAYHQPSNFYMLGSMGMATPIGFGLAISCNKEVIVIDGDGSLLMNPGTLAAIALKKPGNLTIIVIDNGVYSSTGDQPTPTHSVTNLSVVAGGFGLKKVFTVSKGEDIKKALQSKRKGPKFIHIVAKPGNKVLPNIPMSADEIKRNFMEEVETRKAAG